MNKKERELGNEEKGNGEKRRWEVFR